MFKNLGTVEVIVVGFVALLLFGSKKLKELAGGLGESSKELKKLKKTIEGDEPISKSTNQKEED